MAQEAFYEILVKELEKKIRAEIQKELNPEYTSQKANHSFNKIIVEIEHQTLNLKSKKYFYPKKNTYLKSQQTSVHKNPVRAQLQLLQAAQPRVKHLDAENCLHLEILQRLGADLDENFTERELKREFRKLALQFHPDHHKNHSRESLERFNVAKHCYDKLCMSLEK